jgi:hypothetical protein
MATTFSFEIYFEDKFTDEESRNIMTLMDDAASELLIWQAVGIDFVKGFVEYGTSLMTKEEAKRYFEQQIRKLDFKMEIITRD